MNWTCRDYDQSEPMVACMEEAFFALALHPAAIKKSIAV